jgi:hypothetical protein
VNPSSTPPPLPHFPTEFLQKDEKGNAQKTSAPSGK